jgi:hypothetical protein
MHIGLCTCTSGINNARLRNYSLCNRAFSPYKGNSNSGWFHVPTDAHGLGTCGITRWKSAPPLPVTCVMVGDDLGPIAGVISRDPLCGMVLVQFIIMAETPLVLESVQYLLLLGFEMLFCRWGRDGGGRDIDFGRPLLLSPRVSSPFTAAITGRLQSPSFTRVDRFAKQTK